MKGKIFYDSTYMKYLDQANLQRLKVELWFPGTRGRGKEELFNGYRVSVGEDKKLLEKDGSDGCTTV